MEIYPVEGIGQTLIDGLSTCIIVTDNVAVHDLCTLEHVVIILITGKGLTLETVIHVL